MTPEWITPDDETFYVANLPHYVCGVIVGPEGTVTDAAPIARWMVGKSLDYCRAWAERRGGSILSCDDLLGGTK